MDASGPALVPEWLKGPNARSNHRDPSQIQILSSSRPVVRAQNTGPNLIDQDTPRNPASSDGAFPRSSRTAWGSSRTRNDSSNSNKDPLVDQRTCYGINQKSSFSGCDGLKPPSDLKLNDSEWPEVEQQRVCGGIELNRDSRGKKVNNYDRDRYQRQYNTSYRGSNSESTNRFKANKNLKNVLMDSGEELGILPMPPYASSYVCIRQKDDFERSFPALGTEKKSGNSNSNQGNIWLSVKPLLGLSCPGGLANGITRSGNSPKPTSETQKLEELALKQSKQLIPIISTTKLMGRCSSQMLKSKLETAPFSMKAKQHVASSNHTPSVRAPRRHEYTGHGEGRNVMKDKALSTSTGPKTDREDNNFAIDEKKLLLQEKIVFFDSLRKKDTQNLLPVTRNEDSSLSTVKVDELDGKSLLGVKCVTDVKTNSSTNNGLYKSEKVLSGVEIDSNEINSTVSSVKPEKCNSDVKDIDEPVHPDPMNCISFTDFSEEEEIAFMQFLGWDKHAKVEPLTNKEINAFYEQNLEALNGYFQGKPRLHFPVVRSAIVARMTHTHSFDADTGFNTNEDSYLRYYT